MTIQAITPEPTGTVEVFNPDGVGSVVLVCEHASNMIPKELGALGLPAELLESHIAWDIGALDVARRMAELLDAPLIASRVSRLVYDCNRPPEAPDAVPAHSELYAVPGNENLDPVARAARAERCYVPFRDALSDMLDRRMEGGRVTALVTVHSFTPVYKGVRRHMDVGILHDTDARLADALLSAAEEDAEFRRLEFRRNEPYGPADGVTHTLVTQALPRRLLNVMIEIRNDLLPDLESRRFMGGGLARLLSAALAGLCRGVPVSTRRPG